ncbi:MAG TPA: hypothetical protein VK789_28100 [Bryobacteraceae bacterium]|jgi:hypothetical protein|nr:hypothetical protein [Bryobacteraceae bacterium]
MIRASYRQFYGPEWQRYRLALIASRGAVCRDCLCPIPRYVQLTHETHDPRTSSVRIRCAPCHSRADARHKIAVMRRRRARESGQLWLLPEIEYASVPAWEIPREALRSIYSQGSLFECHEL